jgi:3-deoxy-D-manno-octulosonate 8-phosphate phosphatase (KDO 8-P phosphatase)
MDEVSDMWKPQNLLLDVDGVFTDGKIYSSMEGKIFKVFGPDDHDAIRLIQNLLKVTVLTADVKGFAITERRIVGDLNLDLHLVDVHGRADWVSNRFDTATCVYMGDGLFDPQVFNRVRYSIAPANAMKRTKESASFVTERRGSEGAIAEAIVHLIDKFFGGFETYLK